MLNQTLEWGPSRVRIYALSAIGISTVTLFIWFLFGEARWFAYLFVAASLPSIYQTAHTPYLRVHLDRIEHIPFHTQTGRRIRFGVAGYVIGGRLDSIKASEVAGLEWKGWDNIGIRKKSGRVESVSFRMLSGLERERAKQAILDFVLRSVHTVEQTDTEK